MTYIMFSSVSELLPVGPYKLEGIVFRVLKCFPLFFVDFLFFPIPYGLEYILNYTCVITL